VDRKLFCSAVQLWLHKCKVMLHSHGWWVLTWHAGSEYQAGEAQHVWCGVTGGTQV
jgi:hypothetical protein